MHPSNTAKSHEQQATLSTICQQAPANMQHHVSPNASTRSRALNTAANEQRVRPTTVRGSVKRSIDPDIRNAVTPAIGSPSVFFSFFHCYFSIFLFVSCFHFSFWFIFLTIFHFLNVFNFFVFFIFSVSPLKKFPLKNHFKIFLFFPSLHFLHFSISLHFSSPKTSLFPAKN